jgi:hypothetical protein
MGKEMDDLVERVAELVFATMQREEGMDHLSEKRWDDLEGPSVEIADRVAQKVLAKLLGKQAEELQERSPERCCRCRRKLDVPTTQSRSLMTRRGTVHWKTPVRYCAACRRDFFPAGEGVGD